ncbi:glycosyltransferase [Flavihumibacter sp. UBA7668]|uniref:glycosyltransferase n=1 Tax=Flavihumibacter sp. UBA7668 TaxID=1946542 RepID=UPI0025C493D3|nr:glycosyltransferase [Flavihumibacter sp. UBA7668]
MTVFAIILFLLVFAYAWLIQYYHRNWKAMPEEPGVPAEFQPETMVSVLIPARNEAATIRSVLNSYLHQNYPPHLRECIVIDDYSNDETAAIVKEFSPFGIQLIQLAELLPHQPLNSYKKKAIESGIAHSSGQLLLTTDADCVLPPDWILQHVNLQQRTGAVFIAGPVKIKPENSWLNRFQSLDFISLQGITGASLFRNLHAMCNGANLSYTKEAFIAVNGFEGIDHIASGDDMLLMQKISNRFPGKISYLKSTRAIVETNAMPDIKSFLQQRIRWASKATSYKELSIQWILLLVYFLNLSLLFFFIFSFFFPGWLLLSLGLILLKALVEWPFMLTVASFFGYSRLAAVFPLFQPLHILYTVAAGAFGQFGSYNWKGRKVR